MSPPVGSTRVERYPLVPSIFHAIYPLVGNEQVHYKAGDTQTEVPAPGKCDGAMIASVMGKMDNAVSAGAYEAGEAS